MTKRSTTAAPAFTILALLLPLLFLSGVYVGGYFWLGKRIDWYGMFPVQVGEPDAPDVSDSGLPNSTLRIYPRQWLATIYTPAAWIEEKVRGVTVNLDSYDGP